MVLAFTVMLMILSSIFLSQPDETYQLAKITECIVDIKNWMTSNFLLLNSEKTEMLIIGPTTFACNNLDHCLILDGCSVNSSSSVRNLGIHCKKKIHKIYGKKTAAVVAGILP